MGDSEPLVNNHDVERGQNTECAQGNTIDRSQFEELFKLFEDKRNWDNEDKRKANTKTIEDILKKDKTFLTSWVNMKYLIYAAKYNEIHFHHKQAIVNTIVNIGYESFQSEFTDIITSDTFHALFFVAAKGDNEKLRDIVEYFQSHDVTKIYDTIYEGDTVLSFMIKFGNYFQRGFLQCLQLMVEQNIDIERVDYFNRNIRNVIQTEIDFFNSNDDEGTDDYVAKLNEMNEIINRFSQAGQDLNSNISGKYKLFQSLIKKDNNFSDLIEKYLLDADDGQNTLLQLAIITDNLTVTKELLAEGANPNHVVEFGNKDVPLVLAAKLKRENIFRELLKHDNVKITDEIFSIFVTKIESKLFNYLLESNIIDINVEYKGNTPLFYAIRSKNGDAVQSLLRKGSSLNDILIENINHKHLEDYLNSCIRVDTSNLNTEETDCKPLLVFDFFENLFQFKRSSNKSTDSLGTEVAVIRNLGKNKRLKYLLEHPLIHIFIILKWHCVKSYYIFFLMSKLIFYLGIDVLICTGNFNIYSGLLMLFIQVTIVSYNNMEFKWAFTKYPLHYVLEVFILLCLAGVCIFTLANLGGLGRMDECIVQTSAFLIIFTSFSILLTIGNHFYLAKWTAMARRVSKNFGTLLLFFMIPIIGFATAFKLLNSIGREEEKIYYYPPLRETADFDSLPHALFRTIIMLGGDIGDKYFDGVAGYVIFILFTIVMAIILLNFWTGVAVSDIKKIEEQSTIVAFRNIVVFIEAVERIYNFFWTNVFQSCIFSRKFREWIEKTYTPLLKSKICLNDKANDHFQYGVDFYMNSPTQFKNPYFKDCRIPYSIVLKIKSLFEEKETPIEKTLKEMTAKLESLDDINAEFNRFKPLFEGKETSIENTLKEITAKLKSLDDLNEKLNRIINQNLENQIDQDRRDNTESEA